jgi:hypothetical protein
MLPLGLSGLYGPGLPGALEPGAPAGPGVMPPGLFTEPLPDPVVPEPGAPAEPDDGPGTWARAAGTNAPSANESEPADSRSVSFLISLLLDFISYLLSIRIEIKMSQQILDTNKELLSSTTSDWAPEKDQRRTAGASA